MVLDALFNGQIYPAENVLPKGKDFRAAVKKVENLMNYFEETMNKEEYEKIEKLNDYILESQGMLGKEQFKTGCVLGCMMMREVYEYPILKKD